MEKTGTDIADTIATLRRLQEIDRERAHLSAMKEHEPRRLAEAQTRAAQAEQLLDQLDQHYGESHRKIDRLELDIKSRQEKINRHRNQMLAASSNREYQGLMKELSLEEVEKARVEEELLDMMIAVEGFAEREKEVKARIEASKAEVESIGREVEAALAQIAARETELEKSRREVASALKPDALRHYERLFESRSARAVVKAVYQAPSPRTEGRYLCEGCNMSLSHQMVNLLLLAREIVYCRSCGRILFADENMKGEG